MFRAPFIPLCTGGTPISVATADLDADGMPDLIVANSDVNTVSIFLRHADGTPGDRHDYPTAPVPFLVRTADVNADGRIDLVIGCGGTTGICVLLGMGDGSFGAPIVTPFYYLSDLVVGDVNRDGLPDLAAIPIYDGWDAMCQVMLGRGDGTFGAPSAAVSASAGGVVTSEKLESDVAVDLADLDGDGVLDLVLGVYDGGRWIEVLHGLGNGSFSGLVDKWTGLYGPFAFADLNRDGRVDMVMIAGGGFSVLLNQGGGTMSAPSTFAAAYGAFVFGDINRDGWPDLIVAGCPGSVLLGDGHGGFTPRTDFLPAGSCAGLCVADLTGDGRPDLVIADPTNRVVDVIPNGDGGALGAPVYPCDGSPAAMVLADLDRDGRLDLVTAARDSSRLSVRLGTGDGRFGTRVSYPLAFEPGAIAAGDLTGDGITDLAIPVTSANQVWILRGDGAGGFPSRASLRTGAVPVAVAIGDLDGDGHADLVIANQGASTVSVYRGNGDGTYGSKADYATGASPEAVVIADLNHDARPDLAVATGGHSTVSVLLGNGDGTFRARADYGSGHGVRIAAGDADGDGVPDLVLVTVAGALTLFHGLGDGTFAPERLMSDVPSPSSVAIAELNRDGHPDLVASSPVVAGVGVMLGTGGGLHLAPQYYGSGAGASALAVADLNGDGSLDLLVADSLSSSIAVLLGTSVPLSVGEDPGVSGLALAAPYPNPAHDRVSTVFDLPRAERASLRVLDLAGRTVRLVAAGPFAAGHHTLRWDMRTARGAPAPPGLYFVELRAGNDVRVRRLVLR
jgi:hypothetical protein